MRYLLVRYSDNDFYNEVANGLRDLWLYVESNNSRHRSAFPELFEKMMETGLLKKLLLRLIDAEGLKSSVEYSCRSMFLFDRSDADLGWIPRAEITKIPNTWLNDSEKINLLSSSIRVEMWLSNVDIPPDDGTWAALDIKTGSSYPVYYEGNGVIWPKYKSEDVCAIQAGLNELKEDKGIDAKQALRDIAKKYDLDNLPD